MLACCCGLKWCSFSCSFAIFSLPSSNGEVPVLRQFDNRESLEFRLFPHYNGKACSLVINFKWKYGCVMDGHTIGNKIFLVLETEKDNLQFTKSNPILFSLCFVYQVHIRPIPSSSQLLWLRLHLICTSIIFFRQLQKSS